MTEIILHQYDRSPFSEKVRLVFGLKGVSWRAVDIPAWAPKPDLTPLTGGYRKTPVMQIGADIYCDTRIILREIDRRFPQPGLYGAGGGELVAAWADSALFISAVAVAFGSVADSFPKELREDREKFTGGRFSADRFKAAQPTLPRAISRAAEFARRGVRGRAQLSPGCVAVDCRSCGLSSAVVRPPQCARRGFSRRLSCAEGVAGTHGQARPRHAHGARRQGRACDRQGRKAGQASRPSHTMT